MHSDEEVGDRDKLSIWFCIQVLLTTLAFIAFLIFLRKKTSEEYASWDAQTTTISDYTMHYEIPEKVFIDFRDNIYPKIDRKSMIQDQEDGSPGLNFKEESKESQNEQENSNIKFDTLIYEFKLYLKSEFEDILRKTDYVKYDDQSMVEIAHIHLNFDNVKIYNKLQSRGDAIKSKNIDKKAKIEKEIEDYCISNQDKLCVPKEAYIIFETEEAYHRAMKLNSVKKCGKEIATKEWNDTSLILESTSEPTNIYFENKFESRTVFIIKLIIVSIVLFIALCLTCFAIFFFQDQVNRLNRQYPLVDCDVVVADSSPEMLVNLAMIEYYNYETSDKSDETILMQNTDNLQCFCDDLVTNIGYLNAYNRNFDVNVLDEHITGKVCNNYLRSAVFIQATSVILPLLIIIFNVALKMLAIFMIQWLRFENKTIEISIIQSGVFVLLFFNSALAILVINAYVPGAAREGGILFNGLYSDFSDDWYDKISEFFVSPMFIEVIYPLTMFIPDLILQKGMAMLDRNFSNPKHYKTRCHLAYDYAELNSGTEHLFYQKYPRLLNIVFVSTFYGFGLPLLPIIIFISLIVSYFMDKPIVMFFHRKPPLYDDTLNKVSIEFLKWAAFFYIAISYWMLTNKQMFGNDLHPIEYQAKIETYDHYVFEMPEKIQVKIVLLVALIILIYCTINVIIHILDPLFESTSNEEIMEFEGLKPFSKALNKKDLQFWYSEEKNIREKLGYKYLFDSLYRKLSQKSDDISLSDFSKEDPDYSGFKDFISDVTNYDLLYNLDYSHRFSYIPAVKRMNKK